MKRRRIARGTPALIIPMLPPKDLFIDAFEKHWGDKLESWWLGVVTPAEAYEKLQKICETSLKQNEINRALGWLRELGLHQ